jgi:hypothetical protein
MQSRTAARVLGIIYVIVGIIGFIPGISQPAPPDAPHLALAQGYAYVLGLFAVNWLHDLVHIAIGLWGLVAAGSLAASRTFFRTLAVVFAVLFLIGVIPSLNTVFGIVPLFGWDAWLHLLTAIVGVYFGWGAAQEAVAT